jgi:predicted Rdx family selenoprotein
MGYVPVSRDAGRIMYESAINRADILANTITGLSEKMYQRDQENKAFGAKLKSLESLLQTHKDKFGMSEEQVKQFLSQDPNQSPKERYLRIGSFIEDSIKMSQLQKEQQQLKEAGARTALTQAQADEMRAEMARRQAVARMLGIPSGDVTATPSPAGAAAAPSGVAPMAAAPSGAPPPVAPQAAAAPQMGAPVAPSRAPVQAPPAVEAAIRGLEAFTPDIAQQAQREAALKFYSTGQYSDPTVIAKRLVEEKRKQAAEERQMTLDEAKQKQAEFEEQERLKPFGQRRAATVKESGTSGFYVLNIAPAEMTGIERQQMEAGTQEEKERIGRIGALITRDRDLAAGDRTIAPAVSGLSRLLSEDKIEGDALTQLRTTIRSFGKALNFPVDEQKLGDAQTATAYFGQLVLPVFNQTKGAISDKETALFQTWSPQLGLNKKANIELLSVIDKRMKFNRKLEELGLKVDSRKMPINEYVMERQKLLNEYDESLPTVEEFLKKAGAPSQTISQSIPEPVVPGRLLQGAVDSALSSGGSAASALYEQLLTKAAAGKTPSK